MKIERIQVHVPSVAPGLNGVAEHQRVSGLGDSPHRQRQQRQSDDDTDADKDAREHAERLNVDAATPQDLTTDNPVKVSPVPTHLLDIEA